MSRRTGWTGWILISGNMLALSDSRRDPQIGRFLSVDPLAAFGGQDSWSPYAAMGNNPGMMVDPLGLQFQDGGFAGSVGDIHVTILGTRYPESRFINYSNANFARTLELLEEYAYLSRRIHELRNPVPTLETAPGGISGPIAPMVFRGFYPAPAPVKPAKPAFNNNSTWQGSGFYRNFGGGQANVGEFKGNGYTGWVPELSILGNASAWLNNKMAKNWIGDIAGPESSWMGNDGFKNKGWPTIKITVGVISTALSGGMFGFYATSANATTIGTTIGAAQLGISVVATASDVSQGAFNHSLPYSEKLNYVNNRSNLLEAVKGNPIGIIGVGMWYADYTTNK